MSSKRLPTTYVDVHHTNKWGPLTAKQLKLLGPTTTAMIRDKLVYEDPTALKASYMLTQMQIDKTNANTLLALSTGHHN